MMSRRRSLFTFGALLAAAVLLAPATALAQVQANSVSIASTSPSAFDKLEVEWDSPTNTTDLTGYRIYFRAIEASTDVSTAGTPAVAVLNAEFQEVSGAGTEKATLTGLTHNTRYIAAVVPLNDDGDAEGTLVQSTEHATEAMRAATTDMAGAPAPPRGVMAMGGDGTFKVMWDAPYAGEAGLTIKEYRVQKREVSGGLFGDWVPDEGDDEGGKKVDGDMTMITFEGLKNGTTYQARVMATNSADVEGDYSIRDGETPAPGDESATVGDDDDMMTETPALPLVGILLLGAGLVAAGRRRLRQ